MHDAGLILAVHEGQTNASEAINMSFFLYDQKLQWAGYKYIYVT